MNSSSSSSSTSQFHNEGSTETVRRKCNTIMDAKLDKEHIGSKESHPDAENSNDSESPKRNIYMSQFNNSGEMTNELRDSTVIMRTEIIGNVESLTFQGKRRIDQTEKVEFLKRAKGNFHQLSSDVQKLKSVPTMMIVDMDTPTIHTPKKTIKNNLFGRDIEAIGEAKLFDSFNNTKIRHVMILGKAGSGKSVFCRKYAEAVVDGRIESLRHIELVVTVSASAFHGSTSTPFKFFFTDQMCSSPETNLRKRLAEAGQEWMDENSNKVLIIVDGLDQCTISFGGRTYPYFNSSTSAATDEVLANIMSSHIWHGALVLTTSRFEVFSRLGSDEKPQKVVALRELDENNIKIAASCLMSDIGEKVLSEIEQIAPNLYALCRTPLYLSYTAKLFAEERKNLPDCISGLLAAVVSSYFRSPHAQNSDIAVATKLAFGGMMKNIFEFSMNFLKTIGIDVRNFKCFKGFLSSSTNLHSEQEIITDYDMKYLFHHEILQEFCASLYILQLQEHEVRKLVNTTLNEPRFEMMRKFVYGIMLNSKARQKVENFLEGLQCPIDTCQEILTEQLNSVLRDGVISDIGIISLLHECGDDFITVIEEKVQAILINEIDLQNSDQIILTSLMSKCSHLKKAFVLEFWLNPTLLPKVKQCLSGIDVFEAGYEIDGSITEDQFDDVVELLDSTTKILYVSLHCSKEIKNKFLYHWIDQEKISFNSLDLNCKCSLDNLQLLFKFLEKHEMDQISLNISETVTEENVEDLASSQATPIKVLQFAVRDNTLTTKKLDLYLFLMMKLSSKCLEFYRCNLTSALLSHLGDPSKSQKIKVQMLCFWDKFLFDDGYQLIPKVLLAMECQMLFFGSCNLTEKKLSNFGESCGTVCCKIQRLIIKDKNMNVPSYEILPLVLKNSDCSNLTVKECNLTRSKIRALATRCHELKVELTKFEMEDEFLLPEGYHEVQNFLKESQCTEVQLDNCKLTADKIQKFHEGCESLNHEISELIIKDEKFIPTEETFSAFCHLAQNVGGLQIDGWILDNDQEEQLEQICKQKESKLTILVISSSATGTPKIIEKDENPLTQWLLLLLLRNLETSFTTAIPSSEFISLLLHRIRDAEMAPSAPTSRLTCGSRRELEQENRESATSNTPRRELEGKKRENATLTASQRELKEENRKCAISNRSRRELEGKKNENANLTGFQRELKEENRESAILNRSRRELKGKKRENATLTASQRELKEKSGKNAIVVESRRAFEEQKKECINLYRPRSVLEVEKEKRKCVIL